MARYWTPEELWPGLRPGDPAVRDRMMADEFVPWTHDGEVCGFCGAEIGQDVLEQVRSEAPKPSEWRCWYCTGRYRLREVPG